MMNEVMLSRYEAQYAKEEKEYEESLQACDYCGNDSDSVYTLNSGHCICDYCLKEHKAEILEDYDTHETILELPDGEYVYYGKDYPVCSECETELSEDTDVYVIDGECTCTRCMDERRNKIGRW
jgi:hypothetical protein